MRTDNENFSPGDNLWHCNTCILINVYVYDIIFMCQLTYHKFVGAVFVVDVWGLEFLVL